MGADTTGAGAVARPDPIVTRDTEFFWEGALRGELLGQACAACGKLRHPPRPMCPHCHGVERKVVRLSGRGEVYSWIVPRHPAPMGFAESPVVALVELEEGIRIVSNVVGAAPGQVRQGLPVEVAFEPTRGGRAVPVFRPRGRPQGAKRPRSEPQASEVHQTRWGGAMSGSLVRPAAIAGIGQTEFSKDSGRSELQLAAECVKAALDDAGIDPSEVDGMITFTLDNSDEIGLCRCLGVRELAFTTRIPGGGSASAATLYQAMAAVGAGIAANVVIWRAMNERSQYRFGQPQASGVVNPGGGTTFMEWCMPFGAQTPASWEALGAQRYMETYGVTNEDLGRVSVVLRKHAATNPAAWFHGKPITLEDHQRSRWIVEPVLRLLDCCQESDGGVALVVTSLERARDLRQPPVRIVGSAYSLPYNVEIISNYYHGDLSLMPEAAAVAKRLYARTGLGPRDIQVAMLYEAFTPQVLKQLEAFGFCARGEAKDFVKDGQIELGGSLPVDPNGGLIGEAYIHGMNNVAEGVRQVRGTSVNQVPNVEHVLVSSGTAGAILGRG